MCGGGPTPALFVVVGPCAVVVGPAAGGLVDGGRVAGGFVGGGFGAGRATGREPGGPVVVVARLGLDTNCGSTVRAPVIA
jgi:hypothetical protein